MIRIPKELELDWSYVEKKIINELSNYASSHGIENLIVCLSGGIDSSLTAYLASRAVGKKRVIGLLLPDKHVTPEEDLKDARYIVKSLGIKSMEMEISDIVEEVIKKYPPARKNKNAFGNVKARVRPVLAYAVANCSNGMVVGTSNKTEFLLGYFTKYGDGAADILPIADLYKTQVRKLAEYLGIPKRIILKKSSPRLLPNQLAEEELGIDFETADRILFWLEKGLSKGEIGRKTGASEKLIDYILERVEKNRHKREMPPIIKIN